MSDPGKLEQGIYFYAGPKFGHPEKFYPVKEVTSCINFLPDEFQARSYRNTSDLAIEGYAESGCKGHKHQLNSSGELDPPVVSFGPAK